MKPLPIIGGRRRATLRELAQRRDDFNAVFSTPEGQRVLAWIARKSGQYELPIPTNAEQANFNQGCRFLFLCIIQQIGLSPSEVDLMIRSGETSIAGDSS